MRQAGGDSENALHMSDCQEQEPDFLMTFSLIVKMDRKCKHRQKNGQKKVCQHKGMSCLISCLLVAIK